MNQKAKDYIRRNTLDLESDNRMDSTGYVQYAISEAKAYADELFWGDFRRFHTKGNHRIRDGTKEANKPKL
ncbi:hypothetical protein [Bacteroides uniformis]|uniref:hypothetical protein n=1 Tax=Bacteroides uniformis TaxID=820 RepID=UPI00101DC3DC|nr:hypothetical protein [Bacteroides uniformis]